MFEKHAETINHKILEDSVGGLKKVLSGKGFCVYINLCNKGKVLICDIYISEFANGITSVPDANDSKIETRNLRIVLSHQEIV